MSDKNKDGGVATMDDLLGAMREVKALVDSKVKTDAEKQAEYEQRFNAIDELIKRSMTARAPMYGGGETDPDLARYRTLAKGNPKKAMTLVHRSSIRRGREEGLVADFQRASDDMLLAAALAGQLEYTAPDEQGQGGGMKLAPTAAGFVKSGFYQEFERVRDEVAKAMDTATSGEGQQWVPTGFSQEIFRLIELELRVPALFRTFDLPQIPFDWPFSQAKPTPLFAPETTVSTGNPWDNISTYNAFGTPTGKVTYQSRKMRLLQQVSRELSEDAIAAFIPWLRETLVGGVAQGWERGLINGDTNATHMDYDTSQLTNPVEKIVDGLRDAAINVAANLVDGGGANVTLTTLRAARKSLGGQYAVTPNDLVWIASPKGLFQFLQVAEVLTVDKYGPQATVLSGELGKIDGVPIVVSEWARDTLTAAGAVNTMAGPNTFTSLVLAHRPSFIRGRRPNNLGLESVRLPVADTYLLVLYDRGDFKKMVTTTDKNVAIIRNLTP